jgi:hypothetical protein
MTKYIGDYNYIITPDCKVRVHKGDKLAWESEPCSSRLEADTIAKNWIETSSKGNITLNVQSMYSDLSSFFGGKNHG